MRIPQRLQVFIPFAILDCALDPSRSKKERALCGALFGMFVLALVAALLVQLGVVIDVADFLRLVLLITYACLMLYVAFLGGYSTLRLSKTAQGWRKPVDLILGGILILCGVGILIMVPYALFFY